MVSEKTNNYKFLKELETPCYVINSKQLEKNCLTVMNAFELQWGKNVKYGYSVKTNNSARLINVCTNKFDWYVETVSSDEYEYMETLGCKGEKIILNGPCKEEILYRAIENQSIVNLDNLQEIQRICNVAKADKHFKTLCEKAMLGLRVNFDLERVCPNETTAGKRGSRFGICYENGDLERAILLLRKNDIEVNGLHMHVSTITRSKKVFEAISNKVVEIAEKYHLKLKYIDIGGGFFGGKIVPDKPTMKEYSECICQILKKGFNSETVTLILEPGASVLATSIEYITKVINTRNIRDCIYVTVDGTLLHINPFMRERQSDYVIVRNGTEMHKYDDKGRIQTIAGATCMENDRFLSTRAYEPMKKGDYVIFKDAGAYTLSFNSDFILQKPCIYIK